MEYGDGSAVVYLRHGQKIRICGITKGASFTAEEEKEDYSLSISAENAIRENSCVSGTADSDASIVFTNTKEGIIPTGSDLLELPYLLMMGFAIAVIFFDVRRHRNLK